MHSAYVCKFILELIISKKKKISTLINAIKFQFLPESFLQKQYAHIITTGMTLFRLYAWKTSGHRVVDAPDVENFIAHAGEP